MQNRLHRGSTHRKRKYALQPSAINAMTEKELKTYIRNAGKNFQSLAKRINNSKFRAYSSVPNIIHAGQQAGYFSEKGGVVTKGISLNTLRREALQINWVMNFAETPRELEKHFKYTTEEWDEIFDTLDFNKAKAVRDELFSTQAGIDAWERYWKLYGEQLVKDYDSLRGTSTAYDDIADLMHGDNGLTEEEKLIKLFDMVMNARAKKHLVKSGKTLKHYGVSDVHTLKGKFKGPKRR